MNKNLIEFSSQSCNLPQLKKANPAPSLKINFKLLNACSQVASRGLTKRLESKKKLWASSSKKEKGNKFLFVSRAPSASGFDTLLYSRSHLCTLICVPHYVGAYSQCAAGDQAWLLREGVSALRPIKHVNVSTSGGSLTLFRSQAGSLGSSLSAQSAPYILMGVKICCDGMRCCAIKKHQRENDRLRLAPKVHCYFIGNQKSTSPSN